VVRVDAAVALVDREAVADRAVAVVAVAVGSARIRTFRIG